LHHFGHFVINFIKSVGGMMQTNKKIKDLSILQCNIDDNGISILCKMLSRNKTLEILSLTSNNFTVNGTKAI
jgi:Ran GTPase-activating protein (RanGAP) involved in mRNA processing and transport